MINLQIPPESHTGDAQRFLSSLSFQDSTAAISECEEAYKLGRLDIVDGPLVADAVLTMCDQHTGTAEFNRSSDYLGGLIIAHAVENSTFSEKRRTVLTPNMKRFGMPIIAKDSVEFVIIPRAGNAFLAGIQQHMPHAARRHIEMHRNEVTLEPVIGRIKMPERVDGKHIYICDTMLATGGSIKSTANIAFNRGAKTVTALSMIASPQGVAELLRSFPDNFNVVSTLLHWGLNDNGFIVPGLGDAGDRRDGQN